MSHMLRWPKSYSNTDSRRKHPAYAHGNANSNSDPDNDANRTSGDVESFAGINLYVFDRHLSVERGQCHWLRAHNRELTRWSRHLCLECTPRPFCDGEQYSD